MEIALNKESKRKTPSVIGFRDQSRFFGEEAITLAARFPASSYGYLVDLLGKSTDNPVVELYRKRFPYYQIQADPTRKTVTFKDGDEIHTVEELVAQLFSRAQEFAQDATGQSINECVIVVPGFFGQSEREATLSAARLANLKVLQLINDYTAVALNYGIFQRKQFNETAQYYMFYDMGASKTTATVVSYQIVKDKVLRETLPVVQVVGVGYDRTLGGLEMQLRLRDYLAKAFNDMKKTPQNVYESPRALAKLFKEAGRLKNVLSANAEHYAQIEGLLDEKDFKFLVTREKLEELCADLFERVAAPLNKALSMAGLSIDVVNQVIIFGGATRSPKVQDILKKTIKSELGKNLNADEAAVLGAVYRAADLSTGFKVQKFIVKDAVLLPIQVTFMRESGDKKVVRTLFGPMNAYPQKKVITFSKHKQDFEFNVNYADLDHLSEFEISCIGKLNISRISISNVEKLISEKVIEGVESKGIKAHFSLDDSGLFSLVNVELLLEKQIDSTADENNESPLSKLGSTISKLFSGDSETKSQESTNESSKEIPPTENTAQKRATSENATDKSVENNATDVSEEKKPKIVTIKETVDSNTETLQVKSMSESQLKESKAKIDKLRKYETEKLRRENAINSLESHVIEAQQKLGEEEFSSCGTQQQIDEILKMCSEISDWLYEDGMDAKVEIFEQKLEDLRKKTDEIFAKHWEHRERPDALKALDGMLEGAKGFLLTAKNISQDPEKSGVFTEKELGDLEKAIKETEAWRINENDKQDKLKRNEPVKLTVKVLTDKMAFLDREVKYMVNKIKKWRPKEKPKEKIIADNQTSNSHTETTSEKSETEGDEKVEIEEPSLEIPAPEEKVDAAETSEPKTDDEHTEL